MQIVIVGLLGNIVAVVFVIISTAQPRTYIALACHCIFANSAYEQGAWTVFTISGAGLLMGVINYLAYLGNQQFIPMTGKRARILRGSARKAVFKADLLINFYMAICSRALSKRNLISCLIELFSSGFYLLTIPILLFCTKQNARQQASNGGYGLNCICDWVASGLDISKYSWKKLFEMMLCMQHCSHCRAARTQAWYGLNIICDWDKVCSSNPYKRYRWKTFLGMLLCLSCITPAQGMDHTPVRSDLWSQLGLSSASRLDQLNRQRWNADRSERRRQGSTGQRQRSTDGSCQGSDRPTSRARRAEENDSGAPAIGEVPPRRLEEIFRECDTNPNWVPPTDEGIRLADAIRARENRSARGVSGTGREARRMHARERIQLSFTTGQVPPSDDLQLISESDPDAALLLFHETGGQWRLRGTEHAGSSQGCSDSLAASLDEEICTPEKMTSMIENYQRRLGNMKDIIACASCGIKHILCEDENETKQYPKVLLNDPILSILQLSPEAEDRFQQLGAYSHAASAWPQERSLEGATHQRFWLHPELVEEGNGDESASVRICKHCYGKLKGGGGKAPELPEFSIANGVDFGNPDRLMLPELTLVELYLISPVRLYGSVIKLQAFNTEQDVRVLNGHLIAFMQLNSAALSEIGSIQYPRLQEVRELVSVSFLGDRGQLDRLINGGDRRIPKELTIRPDVVYQWLAALSVLNPEFFPASNIIERSENIENAMRNLSLQLMNEAELIDSVGQQMNQELESDTARVRFGTQQQAEDMDDVAEHGQPAMAASLLRGNADTLGGVRDADTANILHAMRDLVAGRESVAHAATHRITRERDPINEFSENQKLYLGSFPTLFLFGKGLSSTGSVPQRAAEHMILQYHGHFARNRWLLFALMNQNMRHAAARAASSAINTHPEAAREFSDLARDAEFKRQVEQHSDNPDSTEAKKLAAKCRKFIHLAGAKVPYSPAERNEALTKMYSMTYRFGIPSVFLTFSPDDIGSPLVLRWAMNFKGNDKFPALGGHYGNNFESFFEAIMDGDTQFMDIPIADEHQSIRLKKMVTDNPVAAALVFKNIMEVVLEELLGIQPENKIRKTVPLQSRRKGIFGTTTAVFSVTEVQARLTLHSHVAIWGNIPPALMQKAASNENIVSKVAQVLDSQFAAQFPPVIHVKGMLNRIHRNAELYRKPSRMVATTPLSVGLG